MSTPLSRYLAHLNESIPIASLEIVSDNALIARRRRRNFEPVCATKKSHDDSFRWDNSNERLSSIPTLPHRVVVGPLLHMKTIPKPLVILSSDHDLHCADPPSCASFRSKSPPRLPRRRASLEMTWKAAE